MEKELEQFDNFLSDPGSENAKDYLVFPLLKKLFGKKFKKQADAAGADIYIEGQLLVELKSGSGDWLKGFYQALHYSKKGLTFSAVCVIAQKFVAVWKVNSIYTIWNREYCKGQFLRGVGLQDEPFFKYFDYKDFLTPFSGLIQIREYAEDHNKHDLLSIFEQISAKAREVREEIRRLLVQDFRYFE